MIEELILCMCMCTCVFVCEQTEELVVATFDFPGQTAEDLSFHKGALIQVMEHIDAEWKRGKLEGREGLFPAAFTQPYQGTPQTHNILKCGPQEAKEGGVQ